MKQNAIPSKIKRNVCPKSTPLNGPGPNTEVINETITNPTI